MLSVKQRFQTEPLFLFSILECAGVDLPPVSGNQHSWKVGPLMLFLKVKKGRSNMEKLQIVYLPPGNLKPYEKNARKHAPDDIEAIKKSILEDGFNDASC